MYLTAAASVKRRVPESVNVNVALPMQREQLTHTHILLSHAVVAHTLSKRLSALGSLSGCFGRDVGARFRWLHAFTHTQVRTHSCILVLSRSL